MKINRPVIITVTPRMGEVNPAITDLEDRILDAIEGWDIVAMSDDRFEVRWTMSPDDIQSEIAIAVADLNGPESDETRCHRLLRWGRDMSLDEVRQRLIAGER